jgi:hypothetical protein
MKTDKLKYITRLFAGTMVLLLLHACETTNLDLQDDPFELTQGSANANFVLNTVTATFAQQHFTFSGISEPFVRHNHLFGTYANSAPSGTMNQVWQQTYQITSNLNFLENLAGADNPQHIGVGQIVEAFAYVNLVDFIGTAVYSEAVNPAFPEPSLDDGASIYDAMYDQLDEAISNLNKENAIAFEDLFFDGDPQKWIKLANSLKLRMIVQSKLVATSDRISDLNSIIAGGNYITSAADDFQVLFGTSETNPDNRHPYFQQQYAAGNNAGNVYQNNDFMNLMLNTKSSRDPRTPYYFYRQDLNDPPAEDYDHCTSRFVYCYLGGGYDGRDHGDDEGIENDGEQRVAYGIYPGGGAYDAAGTQAEEIAVATASYDASSGVTLAEHIRTHLSTVNGNTANSSNLGGAGVGPFLTASFIHFLRAEASLPTPYGLGATGNSAQLLETAIQMSMDKVVDFSGIAMNPVDVEDYIDEVMTEFNAASGEGQLAIIAREYYIASFGNSVEAYNLYRRTGYPDLQTHVLPSGGDFPRSFFLPSSEVGTNPNPDFDDQKKLTDQVFWDTNPAGFID